MLVITKEFFSVHKLGKQETTMQLEQKRAWQKNRGLQPLRLEDSERKKLTLVPFAIYQVFLQTTIYKPTTNFLNLSVELS